MITKNMEKALAFVLVALAQQGVNAEDDFNYRRTQGRDYGPEDWDEVSCNNLKTCPGWPDKHLGSVGRFSLKDWPNNCGWCPIEGNNCGQHRQSPIDLQRDRADPNSPNWKECEDWHWMLFKDGTCDWEDVEDQFVITRSGLQHKIPVKNNGDIDCKANDGERRFPKLDYSKGYQDWWFLSQTEISVPSEHVQHGKRYAAEVVLSHFYEFRHAWNHVGKVAIFLQDYEGEAPWHFLDKLICRWRREEEKIRSRCNLPPAPVYKMCELYRGQTRSAEDFETPTEQVSYPTFTPLVPPKAIPIYNFGGTPPEEAKPLQLCQGDCDFPTDCAKGLICHRRDAFEAVPGCIGGEQDFTNTDYCVFDIYGEGYDRPTDAPTQHPTITHRPTLTPLDPKPLKFFGSTPPADKFPLQICQGDCDFDDHCAEGLVCFQRNESMPVPGCIGDDPTKTDYCVLDPYGDGSYTFPPTVVPSINPSQAPFVRPTGPAKVIANLGWEPPTPIGECQGDCDEDADCAENMVCFQRNRQFEPVPSCIGGDMDSTLTDYCIYKTMEPTPGPVDAPTTSPTTSEPTVRVPTQVPSIAPSTPPPTLGPFQRGTITFLGWKPPKPFLELCEGDCDRDADCINGLLCFDRKEVTDQVPGCDGGDFEEGMSDYCYDPRVYDTPGPTDPPVASQPTKNPTPEPTPEPTPGPTLAPVSPTAAPTVPMPSASPSASPTGRPSEAPVTQGTGEPTEWVDPVSRLCLVNTQCQLQGLEGFCCPTTSGVYLDCCDTRQDPTSDPTDAPVPAPTDAPVPAPTDAPVDPPTSGGADQSEDKPLEFIGWSPTEDERPLKVCQGDCDINQDCGPGLKCFQRYNAYDPVPGCTGGEVDDSLADYCVEASALSGPAPTDAPTVSPTKATAQPTKEPTKEPTKAPTDKPTTSPTEPIRQDNQIISQINCSANRYRELAINFNRMCKPDSCCSIPRKSGGFCERMYTRLGDEVEAACYHCCSEAASAGYPKEVGPPAEVNPDIPKAIECDQVDDAFKICRRDSCCDGGEDSDWCRAQFALYPGKMESICWYCCYPSYETDFSRRRLSAGEDGLGDMEHKEGDRPSYDDLGRRVLLREENFGEARGTEEEEQKYFDEIYSAHQRRDEETPIVENYDDVFWWPYEWLLKVGSEYYFRYEGTQTTPPCINKAHWRILKDPIRVAPHQIKELERLIAWRINDECQADTAGKPREDGNLDAVDVNRPLQSYHELHRMVFCECQDWPSKFPQERSWCRNWRNRDPNIRFEQNPYNWQQQGF